MAWKKIGIPGVRTPDKWSEKTIYNPTYKDRRGPQRPDFIGTLEYLGGKLHSSRW